MLALHDLYKRFVGNSLSREVTYVPSYQDITPKDLEKLGRANVIVEQVFDFEPSVNLKDLGLTAKIIPIPVLSGTFLWPFAGSEHPSNPRRSYLEVGPYPAEYGDSFLNKMIDLGVSPEEAFQIYCKHDVKKNAAVHLDRRYEMALERQVVRDQQMGFKLAEIIDGLLPGRTGFSYALSSKCQTHCCSCHSALREAWRQTKRSDPNRGRGSYDPPFPAMSYLFIRM